MNNLIKLMDDNFKRKYMDIIKEYGTWKDTYVKYNQIENSAPYRSLDLYLRSFNTKLGQRKLLLSEIEFLSLYPKEFVLYVGAAPNWKGYFLAKLFPETKFIFVDPRDFEIFTDKKHTLHFDHPDIVYIKGSKDSRIKIAHDVNSPDILDFIRNSKHRIYLLQDFFTIDYAKLFAPLDVHLISDIRTKYYSESPSDLDVLYNMAQQAIWIYHLGAKRSVLKFRQPYYQTDTRDEKEIMKQYADDYKDTFDKFKELFDVDMIEDYFNKKLRYLKGEIYLQPWKGNRSSESRLVITEANKIIDYNIEEYENKLYYYNTVLRTGTLHKHKYADKKLNIDYCNDCALEVYIWEKYVENHPDDIKNLIKETNYWSKPIPKHGYLYSPEDVYQKKMSDHKETVKIYGPTNRRIGKGEDSICSSIKIIASIILLFLVVIVSLLFEKKSTTILTKINSKSLQEQTFETLYFH